MGFWNDTILDKNPIVMTSKLAGKGLYQTVDKLTGSKRFAASIQQGGDPFNLFTNGKNMTASELGESEDDATGIRRGQQDGRLTSSIIAALYGGAAYGGAALGGGGGGSAAGGSGAGSAGGFSGAGLGDFLAAEGAGEGFGLAGSSAGGSAPWWRKLIDMVPKNSNNQQSPLSDMLSSGGGGSSTSTQWATPMAIPEQKMNPYTLAAILQAMGGNNGNV